MEITKKKVNNIKLTLFIILSFINIIIICFLCRDSFYIEYYRVSIVGSYLILGIGLYILLFKILNKRLFRLIFMLVFMIIIFIIDRANVDFFSNLFNRDIVEPFKIVMESYNNGFNIDFGVIKPMIKLILPMTYCLIIYLINKISLNIMTLLNGIVLLLVWSLENDLLQSYMYMFIILIFIMIMVNRIMRKMNKDIKKYENIAIKGRDLIWSVIPVALVIMVTIFISSSKQGFLGEQKIMAKINKAVYGDSEIQYGDQSILYKVGYGNSSNKLGGSVTLSDDTIMYVKADRPYYLRGNIKDHYDGRTWQTTKTASSSLNTWDEKKYEDVLLNAYFDENGVINKEKVDAFYNKKYEGSFVERKYYEELLLESGITNSAKDMPDEIPYIDYFKVLVDGYSKDVFEAIFKGENQQAITNVINIRYSANLESHNFLIPNNSVLLKTGKADDHGEIYVGDNNINYDKMGQVTYKDVITDEYIVSVYDSKKNNNNLFNDHLLESNNDIYGYMDYKNTSNIIDTDVGDIRQIYTYDKYSDIINDKYKEYITLPSSVSSAVYVLGQKITKDSNSTIEKVHAIKKYLEDNYSYSLQVDKVNFEKDFVEQFLFDTKKGYCTYFASAMAVLCRTQGIPARYVEGFSMEGLEAKNGSYRLTPNKAHAWCEVLVSPEYDVWAIADPKTGMNPTRPKDTTTITNKPVRTQEEIEADKKELEEEKKKKDNNDVKDIIVNNKPSEDVKALANQFKFDLKKLVLLILLIVFLVGLSLVSIRYYRYYRIVNDKSVVGLYKYYLKKLCYMKYERNPSETDLEFINKTSGTALYPYSKQLVEELNAELYGGIESTLDRKAFYRYINYYIKNDYKKKKN